MDGMKTSAIVYHYERSADKNKRLSKLYRRSNQELRLKLFLLDQNENRLFTSKIPSSQVTSLDPIKIHY